MRIDFHAHILPGMDHGCRDVDMSLQQLELAEGAKVDIVVATSHFYPHVHSLEDFVKQRAASESDLRKAMWGRRGLPKVVIGAEVLICNNLDKMPGVEELCVERTDVMLLEFPFSKKWEACLVDTAIRLKKEKGFRVVLAHADRYNYDAVTELVEEGIELQLNADSVCSFAKYGLCQKYVKTDKVVALGSDIHGVSKAYKNYARAVKRLGSAADVILDRTQDMLKDCISYI